MSISNRNWFSGRNPVVVCFAYCLSWLALWMLAVVCVPARWSASAVSSPAPELVSSVLTAKPVSEKAEPHFGTVTNSPALDPPQIANLSVSSASPGDTFKITGKYFELTKEKNTVLFTGSVSHTPPALALVELVNADGTELTVITPYGTGSGTISVETSGGKVESSQTITVTTSASGDVLDADNSDPVIGARAEFKIGGTTNTAFTSPKGVFMLSVTAGNKREIKIVGSTARPRYGTDRRDNLSMLPDCDNHYIDFIRLHKLNGQDVMVGGGSQSNPHGAGFAGMGMAQAFVPQSKTTEARQGTKEKKRPGQTTVQTTKQSNSQVQPIFKVPPHAKVRFPDGATSGTLNVAIFKPETAPAPLPTGQYSSAIVQIMPFGVVIEGGAKLSFPNRDGLPANSTAKLFRFDQTDGSEKLGTFVEVEGKAGVATVSADGKWVETTDYAITETSYYFVSVERDTATVAGQVLTSNLLEKHPIPGAIVISRGQYTYTDVNGNFLLKDVPVIKGRGDTAIVETDYLRPDGNVLTRETGGVSLIAKQVTKIEQAVVLPPRLINPSPEFTVPDSLTLRVGETRTINLKVIELDDKNKAGVTVTGADFATVNYSGFLWCKNFKLRLAPANKDAGRQHTLIVTATDSLRVRTSHQVTVTVIR